MVINAAGVTMGRPIAAAICLGLLLIVSDSCGLRSCS